MAKEEHSEVRQDGGRSAEWFDNPAVSVQLETVVLEKVKVTCQHLISAEQLETFKVRMLEDVLSRNYIFQLQGFILGLNDRTDKYQTKEDIREETKDLPVSWWDMFKRDVLKGRFLWKKLTIVTYPLTSFTEITRQYEVKHYNVCPHLRYRYDDSNSAALHFQFLKTVAPDPNLEELE